MLPGNLLHGISPDLTMETSPFLATNHTDLFCPIGHLRGKFIRTMGIAVVKVKVFEEYLEKARTCVV